MQYGMLTVGMAASGSSFFTLFWQLAEDETSRNKACRELLDLLTKEASEFDGEGCAPNLEYTLKRLTRGLCSSRGTARQGFSAALTEVGFGVGGASCVRVFARAGSD